VERRQQLLAFLKQSAKTTIDIDASATALTAEFGR
jgi:hypothetical protein